MDLNPEAVPGDLYTIARFSQADGGPGRVLLDGYQGHVQLTFRQSWGPATAPAPMPADGEIGGISGLSYGDTGYNAGHSAGKAAVTLCVKEVWTDTAQGAYVKISTTPKGTNLRADTFAIDHDGSGWVMSGEAVFAHKLWDSSGTLYSAGVRVQTKPAVSMPLALAATAVLCFGMGLAWSSMAGGMAGSAGRLVASALR